MPSAHSPGDSDFLFAAFEAIMRCTSDMVFVKDTDLIYRAASQSFAEMAGHPDSSSIVGRTDREIFEDQSLAEAYIADDKRLLASGEPLLSYVEPITTAEGAPRYGSTSKYLIRDGEGRTAGMFGITRDVTREHTARVNFRHELEFLTSIRDDTCISSLMDITDWRVISIIPGPRARGEVPPDFEGIDEYLIWAAEHAASDEDVKSFLSSFSRDSARSMFESGKRGFDLEYERRPPHGEPYWVRDEAKFIMDPSTGHLLMAVALRDIDAEAKRRDELVTAAEHDALTGLLNRGTIMKRIERYLHNEGAGGTHALFMVDLDNFKNVNDTYGHRSGDRVISAAAGAIRSTFRESDIVGRIGGDEFFALMKNTDKPLAISRKARDLLDAIRCSCSTSDGSVELSGSVGISLYRSDCKSLETLYAEADAALYRAKAAGKDRFAFSDSMGPADTQFLSAGPAE